MNFYMSKPGKQILTDTEINNLPIASKLLLVNEFEVKYFQYQLRLEESSRNAEVNNSIEEVGMAAPSGLLGARAWIEMYLDNSNDNISPNDEIKIPKEDIKALKYISEQFSKNVQFLLNIRDIKTAEGIQDIKDFSKQIVSDLVKNDKAFLYIRTQEGTHVNIAEYERKKQENDSYKYYKKIYDVGSGAPTTQKHDLGIEYVGGVQGHLIPSLTYEISDKEYKEIIEKDIENSIISMQHKVNTTKQEKYNKKRMRFIKPLENSTQVAFELRYGSCAASNIIRMLSGNVSQSTFHALYDFISTTQHSDLKNKKNLKNIDTINSELNFLNYIDDPVHNADKYAYQGLTPLTKNRVIFEVEPNSIKQITNLLENQNLIDAVVKKKLKAQFDINFTDYEIKEFRKNNVPRINRMYMQLFNSAINDEDIVVTSDMIPSVNKYFLKVLNKNGGILTNKNFNKVLNDCRNELISNNSKVDLNIQASIMKDLINEGKEISYDTPFMKNTKQARDIEIENVIPKMAITTVDKKNLTAYEIYKRLRSDSLIYKEKIFNLHTREKIENQLDIEERYSRLYDVSLEDRESLKASIVYTDNLYSEFRKTADLIDSKLSLPHVKLEQDVRLSSLYEKMFETAIKDTNIILTPSMLEQTRNPLLKIIEKYGNKLTARNFNYVLEDWRKEIISNSKIDLNIKASVTKDLNDKQVKLMRKKEITAYDIYKEMSKENPKLVEEKINFIEPGMKLSKVREAFKKNNVKLEPRLKKSLDQQEIHKLTNKQKENEYTKVIDDKGKVFWKLKSPIFSTELGDIPVIRINRLSDELIQDLNERGAVQEESINKKANSSRSNSVDIIKKKLKLLTDKNTDDNIKLSDTSISRSNSLHISKELIESHLQDKTDNPIIKIVRIPNNLVKKASNYKKVINSIGTPITTKTLSRKRSKSPNDYKKKLRRS